MQFVVHELGHRIKNLLAVVQALANQTAQRSATVKEFQTVFSERLQGLSRFLDLLVEGEGRGATIADLVRSQLGPFAEIDGMRIATTGPVVTLNPEATQNIGLALHELATNATKHGALSVPKGAVTVDWEIGPSQLGPSRFRFNWHEHHGPQVVSPQRRGFGHVVLQRMTGRALQGKVSHEFGAGGVSWILDVPAAAVVMQSRSELPITVVPKSPPPWLRAGMSTCGAGICGGFARVSPARTPRQAATQRGDRFMCLCPCLKDTLERSAHDQNHRPIDDRKSRSEIKTCQMPNAESKSLATLS